MDKTYMLPDEIALAKEFNFAMKKYDLLKDDTSGLSKIVSENNDWITHWHVIAVISQRLREHINFNTISDKKDLNYLQGLSERISLQREIIDGVKVPFDISNIKPEYYTKLKAQFYPTMEKCFNYRFNTMQDKYQTFMVLENLRELRPYLKEIQPYLNHMSNTHIPTKGNYHPMQVEFAIPILYEIQKAKDMKVSEASIQKAIQHLNESKITSPEHFKSVLSSIEIQQNDFENVLIKTTSGISPDIKNAINETVKSINDSKERMQITPAQISILETAQTPTLVKAMGDIMSKGYVSNEVAQSIVNNVNLISKVNPDTDINHLTQTLSLVGQLSRMTPQEMNVLGELILDDKDNLSFYNIREKALNIKETNVGKSWSPNKNVEKPKRQEKELAFVEK